MMVKNEMLLNEIRSDVGLILKKLGSPANTMQSLTVEDCYWVFKKSVLKVIGTILLIFMIIFGIITALQIGLSGIILWILLLFLLCNAFFEPRSALRLSATLTFVCKMFW